MTRFLESKSIEMQMEDAEREREVQAVRVDALSPVEIERRESIRLSIARTQDQLQKATNPRYRKMLRRALRALESEMR